MTVLQYRDAVLFDDFSQSPRLEFEKFGNLVEGEYFIGHTTSLVTHNIISH